MVYVNKTVVKDVTYELSPLKDLVKAGKKENVKKRKRKKETFVDEKKSSKQDCD